MSSESFGAFVQEVRARKGLSQRDLADMLQVNQTKISRLERGAAPSPELEEKIKALFGEGAPGADSRPLLSGMSGSSVLLAEMTAARILLGAPMGMEERTSLAAAEPGEVLTQSALLREALEVRASRELLVGAQAFRRRRERPGREEG